MIMENFDDIRPYNNEEAVAAIKRLAANEYFPIVIKTIFPEVDVESYRNEFLNYKSIEDFQYGFMSKAVGSIIKKTSTGLTYNGIGNINKNTNYMLVSNHRDIALDATLLGYIFHSNDIDSFEITFGSNLMQGDFVIDFGKINKMFKISRGGNARDFYKESLHVSKYMRHVITEKRQSVWIAQRNGRTKDGYDQTELGVLKMFSLSSDKEFTENLKEINILPISISYEYEPCDFLKTMEIYISSYQKYVKEPGEDLRSIITGIMQPKGQIHISITKPITEEELKYCDSFDKNNKFVHLGKIIDYRILSNYKLYKTNYIAHDILNQSYKYEDLYSKDDKKYFIDYMRTGLSKLPCKETGEIDELEKIFLTIYANPIDNINKLKS